MITITRRTLVVEIVKLAVNNTTPGTSPIPEPPTQPPMPTETARSREYAEKEDAVFDVLLGIVLILIIAYVGYFHRDSFQEAWKGFWNMVKGLWNMVKGFWHMVKGLWGRVRNKANGRVESFELGRVQRRANHQSGNQAPANSASENPDEGQANPPPANPPQANPDEAQADLALGNPDRAPWWEL